MAAPSRAIVQAIMTCFSGFCSPVGADDLSIRSHADKVQLCLADSLSIVSLGFCLVHFAGPD